MSTDEGGDTMRAATQRGQQHDEGSNMMRAVREVAQTRWVPGGTNNDSGMNNSGGMDKEGHTDEGGDVCCLA